MIRSYRALLCRFSARIRPTTRPHCSYDNANADPPSNKRTTSRLKNGPPLEHFIANSTSASIQSPVQPPSVSYLHEEQIQAKDKKVYFETYGCQMNVNDTEIAAAILEKHGYTQTTDVIESDAVLIMTCSIREGAEQKIWRRLDGLKKMQAHVRNKHRRRPFKIGILGCMAENLKKKILEKEKAVDIICGPDAYRDLPHLLAATAESHQAAVNVQLSLEETYADVMPVRVNPEARTAFVSIMRGCDNMCSYCIVPFTRGRERSRPIDSILDEIRALSEQGVKEVTLLGQNVNSYRDTSESAIFSTPESRNSTNVAKGFKTVYKPKVGGRRFSDLLDKVSQLDPEMRIRFTSPHPKDFPDEVLHLISERNNICNQLHMPAQSGSSSVLDAMRRGYTREAYIDLIHRVREILPDVSLSSDFISGFCGETEEDHKQTLSLISLVKYDYAFCFPYSMRGKTRAFHKLSDDVPQVIKNRRHEELQELYRRGALQLNQSQHGSTQLVLVEGNSKRSECDFAGRNDGNMKVIFPKQSLAVHGTSESPRQPRIGDYVAVQITGSSPIVLTGNPLYISSLTDFSSSSSEAKQRLQS